MAIDDSTTIDNNASQTTTPDSGAADPVSSESSAGATSTGEGASADAGAAQASQTDAGPGSLTSGEAQSPNKSIDLATYEKRVKDSQRAFQLERQRALDLERRTQGYEQQLRQMQEQFDGVNPDEVKQYRERSAAPVWSKKHPEHGKFQALQQQANFIEASLRRCPTEKRAEMEEFLWGQVGTEGINTLQSYREHLRTKQQEMLADPDSYFEEQFKRHFEPQINQWQGNVANTYEQSVQAEREVKDWFDKSPKEIWTGKQDYIKERLNKGASWQQVQLELERDHYRTVASSADNAKRSAEEKERLLRGNAATTVAHDPKTSRSIDPMKIAKERGIDPANDMAAYFDLLQELKRNNQLG